MSFQEKVKVGILLFIFLYLPLLYNLNLLKYYSIVINSLCFLEFYNKIIIPYKKYKISIILFSVYWIYFPTIIINYFVSLNEILDIIKISIFSDMMQQLSFKFFTYYFKNNESLIYRLLLFHPVWKLSPNKTIIGYLGGLSTLLFVFFTNYSVSTIFILYITGCMGDLLASYFKRLHKIENYSNLLGAHGGFLDRCDSIILNVHVIFIINFINK